MQVAAPKMSAFQVWKDYFQLAKVVAGLGCGGEELGCRSPGRGAEGLLILEQKLPRAGDLMCSFCKHNGESRAVYASHRLKDEAGRVQCPVLRNYTCPQCGASQDRAHTRRFCPLTQEGYASVYRGCTRNSAGKKKLRKA
ncbi:nanos homolog 3 [Tiliqua scincoides]|uniref:nanos homolog 3 n=1 Tax=Tiliqua scincoides TaxID=71010 RepID=UPI003462B5D5